MDRQDAILLKKIYDIEKKTRRAVYTGDIVNAHILPKAHCQKKIEGLRDAGFLNEVVIRGANVYKVSTKGLAHMFAYRDIRLETMKYALR